MKFSLRNGFLALLVSGLAACGVSPNMNQQLNESRSADSTEEMIRSGEDFVAYLLETDDDAESFGLAARKGKSQADRRSDAPQRSAAQRPQPQARPQVQARAQPQARPQAQTRPQAPARQQQNAKAQTDQRSKVVQKKKIAQPKKTELVKNSKNKTLVEKAKKAFKKQGRVSAKALQRQNNLVVGVGHVQNVKLMPSVGLQAAHEKCKAISAGVVFLKQANSPQRPFDGLRKNIRAALKRERDKVLQMNGFLTCKAVAAAVASIPAAAVAETIPADEAIPAVDAEDVAAEEVAEEIVAEELTEEVDLETAVFDENGNVIEAEFINYI